MFYDKIDYTIIQKSWESIQGLLDLPYIIHIVGTNGKGSTGRYLSSLLFQADKEVVHYSSPHIEKFNERIWINGKDSSDEELNEAHQFLQNNLKQEYLTKLTYFEYTTLLVFVISDKKEYLVLEAGLGGEFDATNVVKNDLSVFTPIGYDHQSFLGDSLEQIATTKMRSCDNSFILAEQKYPEVLEVAQDILKNKKEIPLKNLRIECDISSLPEYLTKNFSVALNVMNFLKIELKDYVLPKLKGRFQYYKCNIVLDVGHNGLAAQSIADELNKLQKKFILIYNCYEDKDYENILSILKPYVKEIQIIPCSNQRMISQSILEKSISTLKLEKKEFDISKVKANENENYLVFGSFSVVEEFLKEYNKR